MRTKSWMVPKEGVACCQSFSVRELPTPPSEERGLEHTSVQAWGRWTARAPDPCATTLAADKVPALVVQSAGDSNWSTRSCSELRAWLIWPSGSLSSTVESPLHPIASMSRLAIQAQRKRAFVMVLTQSRGV